MSGLTPCVSAWRESGELVEFDGRRIFVHRRDGEGPPLLLLHGYPSSCYDWREVLDLLPGRRAVCFDFLGFGLSDKPRDHVYSLHGQADLAEAVARRFAPDGGIVLVAHDMGTSVASELLAREVDGRPGLELAAVLLFNGSMVLERASLTISQKLLRSRLGPLAARLSNERAFRAQFARIFSPSHPLSAEEAADQWALLAHAGGHRIVDRLTFYLHERVRYAERWHGALRDWPGRLELMWAMRDPVATGAVLDAVTELRPHARVTRLPDLGHYPQLEEPATVAEVIGRLADDAGP
jgi:pimeloyl-ACP methyl ester carboxylesterase